jgi:RTX calcium-binding nonapeptide repeat (4 copies)
MRPWTRSPIATGAAAALVVVLGVAWLADPRVAARAETTSSLAPAQGALLGAWVGQRNTPTHYDSVLAFEEQIGRKLAIDLHYRTWDNPFWGEEEKDIAAGRIPLITWGDYGRTSAAQINSGSQDALIREKADAIRALGGTVLLRWGAEMAGGTFGTANEYVGAWKRIHGIFLDRGATNVEWVWCPTAWSFREGTAPAFYPGDAYVDWICADGFNWYPAQAPWKSFQDIFPWFYDWASQRGKPLMIGETGTMEDPADPGRKATWFDRIVPSLQAMPAIKAFVYFHSRSPKGYEFWTDTSARSTSAFRNLAASPYLGAVPTGGGGTTPPPPPSPSPSPTPAPPPDGDCTIVGTSGPDLLVGTAGADVICGGEGDDTITGGDGADRILGGPGDDELRGSEGSDVLNGGAGHDFLGGGAGDDTIYGIFGNDRESGRAGNDFLGGGEGNDTQDGGEGRDTCDQGGGSGRQASCEVR